MPEFSTHPPSPRRLVAGTMTGTSIDGDLDAALVAIDGRGISMRAEVVATRSWPLGSLADDLRRVAAQELMSAGDMARIARRFGEAHADALLALASDAGVEPDLVVLHGQTVFHAPPTTWQLLDPWPVAARLRCRVRYDLRGANVASGGQGAPITPLADFVLFGADAAASVVINLGGFANATLVPTRREGIDAIRGFDACACNHLLDRVASERLGSRFDADGAAARAGTADSAIVEEIAGALAPPHAKRAQRRSLGTGDEAARLTARTERLAAADACRTVADAVARAIVRVVRDEAADDGRLPPRILLAGGSARHTALRAAIARESGAEVLTTMESHGVPVHMREAAEIAILGALADDGVRYSLPAVTGAASLVPESAVAGGPR
ncbi:MAG: anhydro-N-acetylmuramic acid kinase [Planctomycetaceae bacterium]|nr:anhydro-N-acetylmuramic acid kinase [Planctomycetaceae bacterium]